MHKLFYVIVFLFSASNFCSAQTLYSMSLVEGMELVKLNDANMGIGYVLGDPNGGLAEYYRPAFWNDGTVTEIGFPRHIPNMALDLRNLVTDINEHGQVVGSVSFKVNGLFRPLGRGICPADAFTTHCTEGYVWNATDGFSLLSPSGSDFKPLAIDNESQIVGQVIEPCPGLGVAFDDDPNACVLVQANWPTALNSDGSETPLASHAFSRGAGATAISNGGLVGGVISWPDNQLVLWSNVFDDSQSIEETVLETPLTPMSLRFGGEVTAINENGEAVGQIDHGDLLEPFPVTTTTWHWDQAGNATSLGSDFRPHDIDDSGVVFGESAVGDTIRGTIWDSLLGFRDLNSLMDLSSDGWTISAATSVTSSGKVVAKISRVLSDGSTEWSSAILSPSSLPASPGDFDGNGILGIADLDALIASLTTHQSLFFDMNGDGSLDLEDRDEWLAISRIGGTLLGDTNLDGSVDSTDLGNLLNNFGASAEPGASTSYSGGDLNADTLVDSSDLGLLLNHFGSTVTSGAAVPEPSSKLCLTLAALCLLAVRRRGSRQPTYS